MLIFEKRELDNPQKNWFVVPPLAEALQSFRLHRIVIIAWDWFCRFLYSQDTSALNLKFLVYEEGSLEKHTYIQ